MPSRSLLAAAPAGLLSFLACRAAWATTYQVTESAPDSTAYAVLGGHWGGVARNYPKNLGLSGQLILPIGPALELRGGGSRPSSRTRSPRGRPKIAPRATAGAWGSSGP